MHYYPGVNSLIKNLMINFNIICKELKEGCPKVENIKENL